MSRDLSYLRSTRAENPSAISDALASRSRRPLIHGDGKLMILACDHPARGSLSVGSEPMAMADREELLNRLADGLTTPGVDGLLATPDLIDDLVLWGVLEDKIVIGSLNRGGIRGASFELDDRFGSYTVPSLVSQRLDGAKTLTRIDLNDSGTANTLESTAHAVNQAAEAGLPIMIEPFMSARHDGSVVNDLSPDAVISSMAIVSGLGESSAYTWLKIPYVQEMDRVMRATTLPTLILGGDPGAETSDRYADWRHAMSLDGVRGLVVGRSLLYPPDGAAQDAVARAVDVVHGT